MSENQDQEKTPAAQRSGLNDDERAELERLRAEGSKDKVGSKRETPVWEKDDAPPGSHAGSLLDYEDGKPVRVSGPTHYHHLANGRVVGGYSVGTHYSEPGEKDGDPDRILPIIGIYAG